MANTPYIDLVKPAGTDKALISVLNANSDKIDSAVGGVQDALAIVCNGNTHGAITSGQYVYVRAHDTLQEGLYTANSNIAANATLSSSNLTANSSGGLNALNEQIGNKLNTNDYHLPSRFGALEKETTGSAGTVTFTCTFDRYVGLLFVRANNGQNGVFTVMRKSEASDVFKIAGTAPTPTISADGSTISVAMGSWSKATLLVDTYDVFS